MQHLIISHEQVLEALQALMQEQLSTPSHINVYPLEDYFQAAVRSLANYNGARYEPQTEEWALIVNTNGDIYNHGDAYTPEGLMGNIFEQSLNEIFEAKAYQGVTALRMQRGEVCKRCKYFLKCNQIDMVEALPSERKYNLAGELECAITKPMIEFTVNQIRQSEVGQWLAAQGQGFGSEMALLSF